MEFEDKTYFESMNDALIKESNDRVFNHLQQGIILTNTGESVERDHKKVDGEIYYPIQAGFGGVLRFIKRPDESIDLFLQRKGFKRKPVNGEIKAISMYLAKVRKELGIPQSTFETLKKDTENILLKLASPMEQPTSNKPSKRLSSK